MSIIYINDLRSNLDPAFTRTKFGFLANDSTSRPVLGLGQKLELDTPPLTSGQYGNIRASIELAGYNIENGVGTSSIYNNYSNVDKGQIQYYMDADFINPFKPFFKDTNHFSTKQILPDRTIEYLRQPIVPISRSSSLNQGSKENQWVVDTQNQREDIQALQMRTLIRQNYTPSQLY